MTENTTTPQPSYPWEPGTATYQRPPAPAYTPPPAPNKKPWFKKPAALIPVGALLLGIAVGGLGEPKTVEVTKDVPGPERIVEKEVKVNVPTTPASCLEALDINEQAFTLLSTSLGHVMDGDYAAAGTATDKVKALVPKVNAAKADCRASR